MAGVGRIAQGRVGCTTCPPAQRGLRCAHFTHGLVDAVIHLSKRCAGSEHIGLRSSAPSIGDLSRLHLQADFIALGLDQGQHAFLVVEIQPGHGRVSLQLSQRLGPAGLTGLGFSLETHGPRKAFVLTSELLHEAHRAHGHEIAGDTEAIRSADGQVVDAQFEDGIGLLCGRNRHVAGSRRGVVLGHQLL